jgi:PAS domain S-box-containing protein
MSFLEAIFLFSEQYPGKRAAAAGKGLLPPESRFRNGDSRSDFIWMILENMNDGLTVLDGNGKIEYANRKICEMLGYRPEELAGKDWWYIIYPPDVPVVQAQIERRKQGETGRYECRLLSRDGREIPCLFSAARRSGPNGEYQGSITIMTDITQLKLMEEDLRASEEKYKTILKNSSDGMLIYRTSDYKFVEVNQALADMLERTVEECLQMTVPDTLHPESRDMVMDYVKRRAQGDPTVPTHYVLTALTKSGKKRYWHMGVSRLDWKPGYVSTIMRDITEIKQMEEDLRRQNRTLQEKLRETTLLRKKLSRYQGEIRQLLKRTMEIEEKSRRRLAVELHDGAVQEITSALHRITVCRALIERDPAGALAEMDVMEENLRRGIHELRRIIFDLRPLSLDVLGLLSTLKDYVKKFERETGIRVALQVSGAERELPPERAAGVFRIIQEALHNVRKHSGADRVTVTLAYRPGRLQVAIKDNGCGFSREDGMRAIKNGRAGLLGMKERVQLMAGRFRVTSAPGKGTRVAFSIPLPERVVAGGQNKSAYC